GKKAITRGGEGDGRATNPDFGASGVAHPGRASRSRPSPVRARTLRGAPEDRGRRKCPLGGPARPAEATGPRYALPLVGLVPSGGSAWLDRPPAWRPTKGVLLTVGKNWWSDCTRGQERKSARRWFRRAQGRLPAAGACAPFGLRSPGWR